jgi:hypothetical protein
MLPEDNFIYLSKTYSVLFDFLSLMHSFKSWNDCFSNDFFALLDIIINANFNWTLFAFSVLIFSGFKLDLNNGERMSEESDSEFSSEV